MSLPFNLIKSRIAPTVQRFAPANVIAVDIDGTLEIDGKLNESLVSWLQFKRSNGSCRLMLWSARGHEYAQRKADELGVRYLFDDVVSKPGYIIDDQEWGWTKYTQAISLDTINGTCGGSCNESIQRRRMATA